VTVSEKERGILDGVAAGLSNQAIATAVGYKNGQVVKNRLRQLCKRIRKELGMEVENRVQVARLVWEKRI
jgi:DNA-binding NarL/FixJ family response regulator